VELKLNLKGLEELKNSLDGKMLEKIVGRTLGRTTTKLKTVTAQEVRKTYNIKSKDLKNYIKLKKVSNFKYIVKIVSRQSNLAKFGARQTKKGVSVLVKKGEGRKLITGAFLARGQNGSMRVFKRHTKDGKKLKAFYSLSIPQMFNKDVMNKGFDEAQKTFEKEFEHNLDYYMRKIK
jgi:hypothetical protein